MSLVSLLSRFLSAMFHLILKCIIFTIKNDRKATRLKNVNVLRTSLSLNHILCLEFCIYNLFQKSLPKMAFPIDMQHKWNKLNFNEIVYKIELLSLHCSLLSTAQKPTTNYRPISLPYWAHPTLADDISLQSVSMPRGKAKSWLYQRLEPWLYAISENDASHNV